jgi:hypothetical protein
LTARHILIVTCDYLSTKFLALWKNSWENSVFLVYILHKEGNECALLGQYADSALKINTTDLPVMCGALNTPYRAQSSADYGPDSAALRRTALFCRRRVFKKFPFLNLCP